MSVKAKRWLITTSLALPLLAVGLTERWWRPELGELLGWKNLAPANNLTSLVWRVAGTLAALGTFVYGLWRAKKTEPALSPSSTVTTQTVNNSPAAIVAGGPVQTGGIALQGNVSGDVVAGNKTVTEQSWHADTIIGQQIVQQPAAPTLNALHSLPPPPADFTGRTAELDELRAAMEQGGAHISGLQGQGGIGKTALALKLAESLSDTYPDAQIYLDLRGASDKPMPPTEALAYVIRAFHPDAKLPEAETDLAAIYQSVLRGKRALLLMDNARDAAQIKPLAPPSSCGLLVTSRRHFVFPGLRARDLSALPAGDAVKLLLTVEPRIDGHAEAIAKLCGYLPQALRLAAGALAERRNLDPAAYARRLADEKRRLKELGSGEDSVEAST